MFFGNYVKCKFKLASSLVSAGISISLFGTFAISFIILHSIVKLMFALLACDTDCE